MNTGPQAPAGPATPKPSYKGWAGIRRAFGTPSALTLAVLGFGSGLPFLAIASLTLSTRLRDSGLALHSIGLIRLRATLTQPSALGENLLAQRLFIVRQPATRPDAQGGTQALAQATEQVAREVAEWLEQAGR